MKTRKKWRIIAWVLFFICLENWGVSTVDAEAITQSLSIANGTITYQLTTEQESTSDGTQDVEVLTVVASENVTMDVDLTVLDDLADRVILADGVFEKNTDITSVILPSNIVEIGKDAFRDCTSLTKCDLVEGLQEIGKGAFKSTAITSVVVPASCIKIDGGVEYADDDKYGSNYLGDDFGAFYGCKNLSNVTFTERTSTIVLGSHVFENCTSLQQLNFPNTLTSIPDGVCKGCSSLRKITLPETCTVLNGYAFYNCDLYELVIPDGCLSIGKATFSNNKHIGDITFPESCTSIGKNAFEGCSGLKNITFENADVSLGSGAFPSATIAVSMVFYCDVSIYENSPSQYASTNGIQIQDVSKDDESSSEGEAGDNKDGEETVPEDSTTDTSDDTSGGTDDSSNTSNGVTDSSGDSTSDGKTDSSDDSTSDGKADSSVDSTNGDANVSGDDDTKGNADNSNETETTASGAGIQTAQKGKIYTYKNMNYKVTGSSTVTFMKPVNKKVKKIAIPSKVKILGKTFKVTKINKKACYNCKKLITVTIGNNVTAIGDQAFAKCGKLQKITIGKGLKKIGKKVFYKDNKLKLITIKSSKLTAVGKGTLKGVKKVEVKAPKKKVKKYYMLFQKAK